MLTSVALTVVVVGSIASCGKAPSAMDVCNQLESAGVASNCRNSTPGGLGAAAVEDAAFDLPSVPGHGGMVLRFDKDETYDRTVQSYSDAAMFAGPHRYGSRKARIFMQMNEGASAKVGARAKSVVDALSGVRGTSAAPSGASAVIAPTLPPPAPTESAQVAASAMDICRALESASVASGCELQDAAVDQAHFKIPSVVYKGMLATGFVSRFPNDRIFGFMLGAAKTDPKMSKTPVFGSEKARVLVYLASSGAIPDEIQAKTKAVVDAL